MLHFAIQYFRLEIKKNISLIIIIASSMMALNTRVAMLYNLAFDSSFQWQLTFDNSEIMLRSLVIWLFMVICIYLILYSVNYYHKVNSKVLGLLKIFGYTTKEISLFFLIQMIIIVVVAFGLCTLLNFIFLPLLFHIMSFCLQRSISFDYFEEYYFITVIYFFLIILIILFVELRYIIQTPTTNLLKGDHMVSYKIKIKSRFKEILYCFLFLYGLYISAAEPLSMNLIIPLLFCIYGVIGLIRYTLPGLIEHIIEKKDIKGEMIVILKNCIFLTGQMKTLILFCIMINAMMFLLIYYHWNYSIYMIDSLFIYIISNLMLNYIIFQRFKIRRLDSCHTYKKLYTLGYDITMIQKNAIKEIALFYLILIVGISIYFVILTGANIIRGYLPIESVFIVFGYLVPVLIMWVITDYRERRTILQWKTL